MNIEEKLEISRKVASAVGMGHLSPIIDGWVDDEKGEAALVVMRVVFGVELEGIVAAAKKEAEGASQALGEGSLTRFEEFLEAYGPIGYLNPLWLAQQMLSISFLELSGGDAELAAYEFNRWKAKWENAMGFGWNEGEGFAP